MSDVMINSKDLKALADAGMELVTLKTKGGACEDLSLYQDLMAACSRTYSAIQESIAIHGVYRCIACGTDWVTTSMGEALECPHCSKPDIEPVYTSGVDDIDEEAALRERANHERAFPVKTQKGEYFIYVQRTAQSVAEVRVNACGPASATLAALERAPSKAFGPAISSEYRPEGVSIFTPDITGERFFWDDPSSEDCSGPVTVKEVRGEVICCTKDDGGDVEVFLNELKPL